jgi:hypothetical protein
MATSKNATYSTAVYLLPGMSIQIEVPVEPNRPSGFFAMSDTKLFAILPKFFSNISSVGTPIRGFVVEDKTVGELKKNENGVSYTHKKAQKNTVWFFARSGETGTVDIISVPIHDHGSIVQGGPAYGTYFSDDEEAKTS